MTSSEMPILRGQIDLEIERLEKVLAALEQLAQAIGESEPDQVQLMAVAGFLHNFYNGIENCLARIARGIDEHMPSGPESHRELLDQMAAKVKGLRPEVIGRQLLSRLDEYRRFRHAFRHMYFFDMQWDRMQPLITKARETARLLRQALDVLFAVLTRDGNET